MIIYEIYVKYLAMIISTNILMTPLQKNIFFNLFTWFLILHDNTFWGCTSLYGKGLNIVHQYICSLILFLGPIYGYYYENILLMLITICGWFFLGRCVITSETNKACKDKKETSFRNFPFHIKSLLVPRLMLKKDHDWLATKIDYGILFILILYNMYMSKIITL